MKGKQIKNMLELLAAGFAYAVLVGLLHKRNNMQQQPQEEEKPDLFSSQGIFDCPHCALPAEVMTVVRLIKPHETLVYYIIICSGATHEPLTVTKEWFERHIAEVKKS